MVSDTLTVEDVLRAREILERNQEDEPRWVVRVFRITAREARVVLKMPRRLINKARMQPQMWQGTMWQVVGL